MYSTPSSRRSKREKREKPTPPEPFDPEQGPSSAYVEAAWKYLEELPVATIARRLELSEKAAESLLTRARGAFREAFTHLKPAGGAP